MAKQEIVVQDATPPVTKDKATVNLPQVSILPGRLLHQLTAALGVDRSVVASDEEIEEAWSRLPRLIRRIPPELRDEGIVKACIAVASGLFDAAINYVWNAAIIELRQKVRRFGIQIIPQVLDKPFDEETLQDFKDAELLDLCLRLNLITNIDFFFLDQCRATRNSYSAAHPGDGTVNDDEVLAFFSRCQRHALASTQNPKGVDTRVLLESLASSRFTQAQCDEWKARLEATYDAQRETIFGMLHGIYCDPSAGEEARTNALSICSLFRTKYTPKTQALLVDRHQDYKARGEGQRYTASQSFFEKLKLISLLDSLEAHSMITAASESLLGVHGGWDNFHNEPPFAERLEQVASGMAVPDSAQASFVEAVVTCGVGNFYGVSRAATPSYCAMVKSFSPKEIRIMLTLPSGTNTLADRVKRSDDCAKRFGALVRLLDENSVPTVVRQAYEKWRK